MRAGRSLAATALAVATIAVAALSAVPPAVEAAHARRCGTIYNVVGSRDFRVFATGVTCRAAKSGSRAWLQRRRAPRGFRCSNLRQPGVKAVFFCRGSGGRSFYAERR